MPGCGSRVEYQGGTNNGDVGQFWFRDRCSCSRASGLRIGFGALIRGTAGNTDAVYAVQVRANCCPGGTTFNVDNSTGDTFEITGPGGNAYRFAYDTTNNNAVVLAGSAASETTSFDPNNFNAGSSAYIEAISGCPNELRLRTVNVGGD